MIYIGAWVTATSFDVLVLILVILSYFLGNFQITCVSALSHFSLGFPLQCALTVPFIVHQQWCSPCQLYISNQCHTFKELIALSLILVEYGEVVSSKCFHMVCGHNWSQFSYHKCTDETSHNQLLLPVILVLLIDSSVRFCQTSWSMCHWFVILVYYHWFLSCIHSQLNWFL